MTMPTKPRPDQQLVYFARFDERLRKHLHSLLTDELIAEHKASPQGKHSDGLERVLNYFRRPPKYGLYSRSATEYQLIGLPVAPGGSPEPLNGRIFTSKDAATHAVFLRHVEDFLENSQV